MQPALAPAPHPSMQTSAQVQDHADQVLHDQLIAAQQHHLSPQNQDRPQATRDQSNNIDPAISGGAMMSSPPTQSAPPLGQVMSQQLIPGLQEAADDPSRKTYGKRELSTSKRAAQNRAAQRAFRQRKEGYIRKLEEQVKDYDALSESYKALQAENFQLREYIISLQSRLIDSQNEVPELPGNIDLTQPRPEHAIASNNNAPLSAGAPAAAGSALTPIAPSLQHNQPSAAPSSTPGDDLNQLNRIAVAGLGIRKHHQQHEDAAYAEALPASKRLRRTHNNNNNRGPTGNHSDSDSPGIIETAAPCL